MYNRPDPLWCDEEQFERVPQVALHIAEFVVFGQFEPFNKDDFDVDALLNSILNSVTKAETADE